MLALVGQLNKQSYRPRCYVVAATDSHSAQKALTMEKKVSASRIIPQMVLDLPFLAGSVSDTSPTPGV